MLLATENLDRLVEIYQNAKDRQISLFLGAGVNGGCWAKTHSACASWPKLLEALDKRFHAEPRLNPSINMCDTDWIRVADMLLNDKDRAVVVSAIDEIIYADMFRDPEIRFNTPRKHKVLTWTMLERMPTLRATVCFSAAIRDLTKARSMRRNQKIGRILTTNYDFFFGAAWSRYNSMRHSWWPVTWASKDELLKGAGPIVYLHGYLPYSGSGERNIVITKQDYDCAYAESLGNKKNFALNELANAVERSHLLFIGSSFSDNRITEALLRRRSSMEHFALILKSESCTLRAANNIGVIPIILETWAQLPEALEYLYCAGLTQEELDSKKMTKPQYWSKLQKGMEPRK